MIDTVVQQAQKAWEYLTTTDWPKAIAGALDTLMSWLITELPKLMAPPVPTMDDLAKVFPKTMKDINDIAGAAVSELCSNPLERTV
jgi:hypothetical protein